MSDVARRQLQHPGPRLPIAVAPTAAVLPIRQTATSTRPAGIDLPIRPAGSQDAFHRPPVADAPIIPLAVPASDGAIAPPPPPPELAAPVLPALDPAAWGLDLDPAPATGRRRGAADADGQTRRPQVQPSPRLPVKLFGRGKAGAARLLVLALVVGAEGVAVTAMAGHARTRPADPNTAEITGAYEIAALGSSAPSTTPKPADSAVVGQTPAEVQAQADAVASAKALDASSKAKVTAAMSQAKAAADRVRAATERRQRVSRDAQRVSKATPSGSPQTIAKSMAADRGWGAGQFSCLVSLWNRESGWKYTASNPSSGAYGIPQALPGSKMASAGSDWRTNPATQIRWGLDYIADRYGTPCGAWGHSQSTGWY